MEWSSYSGRLLVADDNPTNRIVVKALVARMGLHITEAIDGQQAVEAATGGECFDLVLMDIQMPLLDGHGATRSIRQWEQENSRPRQPVVGLTADAHEADRSRAMESGMDDLVSKPLKAEDLRALFARWIPGWPSVPAGDWSK